MADTILSIDQGTTSSRAIAFSPSGEIVASAQEEFPQIYPGEGMVEHDPEAIWTSVLRTSRRALEDAAAGGHRVIGLAIANQRETVLVWERKTGRPIHNAIVWQDRRTAALCRRLAADGHEDLVRDRAGLLLDPYFSATKLAWILDNVEGARDAAAAGNLAAGTIDTWLLWKLTGGAVHATDASNASRTCLYGLAARDWDDDLLSLFSVPRSVMPVVRDNTADFGTTQADLYGEALPIRAIVGDQQGASLGQACLKPGDLKATYGTGCFVLVNTGSEIKRSDNRLLSTVAYQLAGRTTYAVEGSIFIAGAAVQWLRDELGLLSNAAETAERAQRAHADADVVMVPAFTGMGAPHWDADARAAVFGMTRATGPDELARAALEGVVYQTRDLIDAMRRDGLSFEAISVDGGMAENDWFVQRLADILGIPIDRPRVLETTALGAAYLGFLQAGVFTSLGEMAGHAVRDRRFEPLMGDDERDRRLARWRACVEAVKSVAAAV